MKRYIVNDNYGYIKSYKTYRRAMQAIGIFSKDYDGFNDGIYKIIDKCDNSVSIVCLEDKSEKIKY